MEEKITLCGDNCIECPRYNAHSDEELMAVAELCYRVGWRKEVVSNEDIAWKKNISLWKKLFLRKRIISKSNLI